MMPQAVGYIRTSSATNVGADKDSEPRQRRNIEAYATAAGYEIVDWFNDPAVSGSDPIQDRPGFAALLDKIEGNGVRVVLVEDNSRFARQMLAQELGVLLLINRGVKLITSTGDELTDTSDEMKVMFRQIAGAFVQFEKARLVKKLRQAREQKRKEKGKCEGRQSHEQIRPEAVKAAKEFRLLGASLATVARMLADKGFLNDQGKRFSPAAVRSMVQGPSK